MDETDLVAHIISLQKTIKDLEKASATQPTNENTTASTSMTPEQLDAHVEQARNLLITGLKGQMKVTIIPPIFR